LHPEREKLIKDIQKLMEERGRKPLEMARKAILEEKIESKEVKEALHYFMTKYWQDLARPTLMSICCEAVGGDPNATIPFAVPLSLISGALDIQDDIIDQSKTKHGQPTVYGKYGKEIAILAADALLFKGFTLLCDACLEVPREKARKVMKIIKDMFYELGDAEAIELGFRGRFDINIEEYLKVIRKKAADVEAHTRVGAILGDGTKKKIDALGEFGRQLGIIFLIRDDYIDMFNPKEFTARIKKESPPLALIYSMQNPETKSLIETLIQNKSLEKNVGQIINIIKKSGGFRNQLEIMNRLVRDTSYKLKKVGLNSNLISFLKVACIF